MNGMTQRKGNSSDVRPGLRTFHIRHPFNATDPPNTERETIPMASNTFKSLVDTTYDSVEGYRTAAEKAESPQLQQQLQQRAQQREQTLQQMNAELQRQGDDLVTKGTMTGEAHQMFASIANAFQDGDSAAANRVEEGEDYIKNKFSEALEGGQLEASERSVVQSAYDEICQGERFGDRIEQQQS